MANVRWEVEDGYCGVRPQRTKIPDEELAECETKQERIELIQEYVQEDLNQLGFYIFEWPADCEPDG